MLLETCSFFLGCQICWHIIVHSILLFFLYFCGISCYFASFILILFIWVLSAGLERSHCERSHWVFLHRSCPPGSVLCGVACHPLCGFTKYAVLDTALSSTSTVECRPWCPSGTVFTKPPAQICSHRSTEVTYQDHSGHAPGHAMGAMEAAQTLALSPCVCIHKAHIF